MFKALSFKVFKNKILALITLFLFTVNYTIIYLSYIIKPYEFDILFSLFIIYMFISVEDTGVNEFFKRRIKYFYLTVVLISIVSSIPAIAIFFLCSFVLFIKQIILKDKQAIIKIIKVALAFLILFGIEYFTYMNKMVGDSSLKDMWFGDGFSFYPNSIDAVNSIINFCFFQYFPLEFYIPFHFNKFIIIGVLLIFFVGTFFFLKKDNFKNGIYICLPVYFFLLLSFMKIYPFTNRCITFLIPLFILIIIKTFDITLNKPLKYIFTLMAGALLLFYLYSITVEPSTALLNNLNPNKKEVTETKLHSLKLENLKSDEVLFTISFPCYYCFNNPNIIPLEQDYYLRSGKIDSVLEGKNKIYFNYMERDDDINIKNAYINHIESKGYKMINQYDETGLFLQEKMSFGEFEKI